MEKSWQQDDLTVTIRDEGTTITVVAVCGGGKFAQTFWLYLDRRASEFWIQDLVSAVFREPNGRRNGLGTLLVNTAIEYVQSLGDERRRMIGGMMSDVGDLDPSWKEDRSRFWNRFGFDTVPGNHVFRSPVQDVHAIVTSRVYGRLPGYVPLSDFS